MPYSVPRENTVQIKLDRDQACKVDRVMDNHHWKIHTCRSLEQIRLIRPLWETLQKETRFCVDVEVDIDRYIYMVESTPECEPYVLLAFRDNAPRAMLIGTLGPLTINSRLGYMKVLKPTLKGLTMIHGGYLGEFCEQTCRCLLDELHRSLSDKEADVVLFRQLPLISPLYLPVTNQSPVFCRRHFPKIDRHWRMKVPSNIEDFYARHSSKTRQTLKRQIRRLEKEFDVHLVESTEPKTLPAILSDAARISSRTYQHALGSGLLDDTNTRKQLLEAAQRGWLSLHVLYLNEEPSAFQLGLRSHGTYFLQLMGFDPTQKQRNQGTVLFLKIMEQLCQDSAIQWLDFGFGDAEYKKRFGTESWDETAVYLFARRMYPLLINAIHSKVSDLSEAMRMLAEKTGIEGKIKRKWRNLLSKTHR
jgi:CelD/BcsL family acetyltransferase involved in cellulose biosynthesis